MWRSGHVLAAVIAVRGVVRIFGATSRTKHELSPKVCEYESVHERRSQRNNVAIGQRLAHSSNLVLFLCFRSFQFLTVQKGAAGTPSVYQPIVVAHDSLPAIDRAM
jgi:hypothetical protein